MVKVVFVELLCTDKWRWHDGGLWYRSMLDYPFVLTILEVGHAMTRNTSWNTDISAGRCEYAVNFIKHCLRVWGRAITAKNRIETCFIYHTVESTILILQLAHVHLFIEETWVCFSIQIAHHFDDGVGDINVGNMPITILEHLLSKARVSSADIQDLRVVIFWQMLIYDIFYRTSIALVPIEVLLVFLITVFPVILNSELHHFKLL